MSAGFQGILLPGTIEFELKDSLNRVKLLSEENDELQKEIKIRDVTIRELTAASDTLRSNFSRVAENLEITTKVLRESAAANVALSLITIGSLLFAGYVALRD